MRKRTLANLTSLPPEAIEAIKRTLRGGKLVAGDAPEQGQFRSYVQDAMTAITGEDFGFDVAAWREWSARRRSLPAPAP